MGQLQVNAIIQWVERSWWAVPESVCTRPQSLWFEFRVWCGGVGANLTAVAIGTETDGSIVCPSAANGVVGTKPTVGLVSRAGIIPISQTQDTAGSMTRTVEDAAIVLGVIAGADPRNPASAASETLGLTDYTPFLDPDGLRGMRLGGDDNFLGSMRGSTQ